MTGTTLHPRRTTRRPHLGVTGAGTGVPAGGTTLGEPAGAVTAQTEGPQERPPAVGTADEQALKPVPCDPTAVRKVIEEWPKGEPDNVRYAPGGVLYMRTATDPKRVVQVAESRDLTQGLLAALVAALKPGEALLAVASYYRLRDDKGALLEGPLEGIRQHVLWLVTPQGFWRVRQTHEREYVRRLKASDPVALVPTYVLPISGLSCPFVEPADLDARMNGNKPAEAVPAA